MRLLIIASVLSIAYAQLHDLPLTTPKPWKGPIADHTLGVQPADTPEVAVAKVEHLTAYRDALSVLPILPPEQRYIKEGSSLPVASVLHRESHQTVHQGQHIHLPVQTLGTNFQPSPIPIAHFLNPAAVPTKQKLLAENVPRSALGEVPEVAAAREAHLKAHEEARRLLPKLVLEQ